MSNTETNAAQANDTNTAPAVHPFEKAGLGKAPFKFIGMKGQTLRYGMAVCMIKAPNGQMVECETKPGGTCDYCGQYIVNMFNIRSADGKEFVVGCDCVAKVADADGGRKMAREVATAAKTITRERKAARDADRLAELATLLGDEAILAKLATLEHPYKRKGETFRDYAVWMSRNAGVSGKVTTLRAIKTRLGL